MYQGIYEIISNQCIARDTWRMELTGDTSALTRPGQFINIKLEGLYLRRPISVCDWREGQITIIYKVVGKGTAQMAQKGCGDTLDILCGLGNGFDPHAECARPVVIGGGVGVPPMYGLAKALIRAGKPVTALLGFADKAASFYIDEFLSLGCDVHVTTDDGSLGQKGFVTDALKTLDYDYYFACGPQPMLKGIHALGKKGQLSFEERMGCGFGACMGCSCHTLVGDKRVCVDGPVFLSGEVAF